MLWEVIRDFLRSVGGYMTWGKCLIIYLGLMLLTYVAHAWAIESYTDSQGTLHITNVEPKKQGSPVELPGPGASLLRGSLNGKAPVTPPATGPVPKVQSPDPDDKAAPNEPVPVDPQPGARVAHTEGSGGVKRLTDRTGEKKGPGEAAWAPSPHPRRVSWSPPQPLRAVPNGKIVMHRGRHGVIHITNVPPEEEWPAIPAPPTPAPTVQKQAPPLAPPLLTLQPVSCPITPPVVQRQALPPDGALPAVQEVSCPELGPEVAAYLEAKLRAHSPALAGKTIHGYRDRHGVLHIANQPAPDQPLPQPRLAASAAEITAPGGAQAQPAPPMPPALAGGPGFAGSQPVSFEQRVVARRDHRGVLHIFTCASPHFMQDRNVPASFPGRISPDQQALIIEAAQLYRLPVSLILALIRQESNFAPQAVSPKGAMGLMQLMPDTASFLGVRNPFDPRENILAGCRYFRYLLDYFQGSVPLALAGYNAGHQRVILAGCKVPAIKETQEFVTQVMGHYYLLEKRATGF